MRTLGPRVGKWLSERAGLAAVLLAGAASLGAAPWREVDSDLPTDPDVTLGTLENGVRYAVMHHGFPENRISLRLLVSVGSREERDEERGLAHFVEHMAFRGTAKYPRGSLLPSLARLGMAPGPDNTAFTSYDNTIYHLELPDATPETLQTGLGVFREFATSITFDADLIDLERAVVLNEKAVRNTPQNREQEANRVFLFPGAREIRRSPIGLALTVSRFTREDFVAFYDAWYRPERMALIVVGDIDPEVAIGLLRQTFGGIEARAPPRDEPEYAVVGGMTDKAVDIYREEGIAGAGIVLEHGYPEGRRPDDEASRRRELNQALAVSLFEHRIRRLAQRDDSEIASPSIFLESPVQDWRLVTFEGSSRVDRWRPLVGIMEQELRRALTHGFTEAELRQVRSEFRVSYDETVRTSASRDPGWLAAQLAGTLLYGNPFPSPVTARDAYVPLLEEATAADCLAAFREMWGAGYDHVFVGTNDAFDGNEAEVTRLLSESALAEVAPVPEAAEVTFAYDDFGPPGRIEREQQVPGLDVRLAAFANRVRLNFKSTDFDPGFVSVSVRIGPGLQSLTERGLNYYASAAFLRGGLGRHSAEELNTILAGNNIRLDFTVAEDAFVLAARASREDLALCLRLLASFVTDAGYRPDAAGEVRAELTSLYTSLANSPGGEISAGMEYYLSGGDFRMGVPEPTATFEHTRTELAEWLRPHLSADPIEVAVVGDTSWESVVAAMEPTFGALPERKVRPPAENRRIAFAPNAGVHRFPTGSPIQSSIAIAFPVPDSMDIPARRRCALLAAVVNELARVALREALGATYTPSVNFVHHEGFQGFDYFVVSADVLPGQLDRVATVIEGELRRLVAGGVSEDVFERAKQPYRRAQEDTKRTNSYWLYTVLSAAQQYPEDIAAARDRDADSESITADDLTRLARTYLAPENARVFIAVPPPGNATPSAAPAAGASR